MESPHWTYQSLIVLERLFQAPLSERPSLVIYGFMDDHEERNVATVGWITTIHAVTEAGRHPDVPYCTLDGSGGLQRHGPACYPLSLPGAIVCGLLRSSNGRSRELATYRSREGPRRQVTEKLMRQMNDLCRSHGARLVVALLEASQEMKSHYTAFWKASGIDFVDCARPLKPGWTVEGEGHPNGALNRLWAADLDRCWAPGSRSMAAASSSDAGSRHHHLSIGPDGTGTRGSKWPGRGDDRAGRADRGDGLVEEAGAGQVDQAVVELLGGPDRVVVPLDQLAELEAGEPLAAALEQAVEVRGHQVDPFVEGRLGAGGAVLGPVRELAEEERVRKRPAADRDRRAAGLAERRGGVGERADVAVADDRESARRPRPPRGCRRG